MEATVHAKVSPHESQAEWEEVREEQLAAREAVGEIVDKFGAAFALQALADAIHREACMMVSAQGDRLIQVAHILHDLSGLADQSDTNEENSAG